MIVGISALLTPFTNEQDGKHYDGDDFHSVLVFFVVPMIPVAVASGHPRAIGRVTLFLAPFSDGQNGEHYDDDDFHFLFLSTLQRYKFPSI